MRQYLSAQQVQATTQIELEELVGSEMLRNLKAREEHPEIRLYSIGHEGEAKFHLLGIGKKTFTWVQAAVRAVADKLNIGTAVFDRHDPNTNSPMGRIQIGEIVGKAVRQIGDRLNTLAAIYIYPQFKSRPLDVASFEAEIQFSHDGHQAWPIAIESVSGIALSNSGIDTPGFPGATLLGAVQAYVQAFAGELGDNKMNQSDVKKAAADLGLTPTQVFGIDTIMSDTVVIGKVKEAKDTLQQAADRWKGEVDAGREKVAKLENQNAEKDKTISQHTVQAKSASVFDTILADPERKLDDKAKIFVRRGLKNFESTAENEDALKVDASKFVDASVKEYGELAKDVFGVETDNTPDKSKVFTLTPEQTVEGQKQTTQTQKPPVMPITMQDKVTEDMNPDTNVLIPGGKAAEEALKT